MNDPLAQKSLFERTAAAVTAASPRNRPRSRSRIGRQEWRRGALSAYLLFATVALAPLPFGSREPTPIALWCIMLGAALVVCPVSRPWRRAYLYPAGALSIAAGYAFVLHEQLAARPWLAPDDLVWRDAARLLGHSVQPVAAMVRGEAFFAMGPPLAGLLAFCLGVLAAGTRRRAVQLLWVSAVVVTAYALYGIAATLFTPDQLLWRERHSYFGNVTGPFPTRNTASVYFGSGIVVWCVLAADHLRRQPRRSAADRSSFLFSGDANRHRRLFGIGGAGLVCLMALLMTGSRAGAVLSLAAAVLAAVLFFRRRFSTRRGLVSVTLGLAALALAVLQLLGGSIGQRFQDYGFTDDSRAAVYRIALRMIADRPWFGSGLGTFVDVFPTYRTTDLSLYGIWELAHSTPLEMAVELGLPLTIFIGILWIVVLVTLVSGSLRRRRRRATPIAALCVALMALAHSAFDFSLQFPGFAIMVLALAGAGVGQSFAGVAEGPSPRRGSDPTSREGRSKRRVGGGMPRDEETPQ